MQETITLTGSQLTPPPDWAVRQRDTRAALSAAALRFAAQYTRPDGTLIWARDAWPGMDGSDDAYESAYNFPLLYALGGDARLLPLAHRVWEGITHQFSAYGQIHREFDAYYDWMHHGEGYLFFYYLSLAAPYGAREHERALRFADFYTGDDPDAPNYDRARRLLRSPLNGSRGPRLATRAEDWAELRGIYSQYGAPFDDLPRMHDHIADWTDPEVFALILAKFNTHIARGDVPLNLLSTSLVTHAFLVTGYEPYRQWVLDYLGAWRERALKNAAQNGVLPDNVGLNGVIGEYNQGRWYGGYYGWGWPHGGATLLEACAVAGMNATLLTGDSSHLDLFRSQVDWLWAQGREVNGQWLLPFWRDEHGWRAERPADTLAHLLIAVWAMTQQDADRARLERFPNLRSWDAVQPVGWGDEGNVRAWYRYMHGQSPAFPTAALHATNEYQLERLQRMAADSPDPHQWPPVTPFENDVHVWQNRNPVSCESLTQMMCGAPMPIYHGGLLHAPVRYFDPTEQRAGLPADVAALVERVDAEGLTVQWMNLDPAQAKAFIVQGGAFGEHALTQAHVLSDEQTTDSPTPDMLPRETRSVRVELAPGAVLRVRLTLRRFAHTPSYQQPW
jgi:hypothetical protein